MNKGISFCLLVMLFAGNIFSQSNASDQEVAMEQISALKNGALVVRLKTNDKSVEGYKKSGKNEWADKIVEERKVQNRRIADAFRHYFTFCKVYFIYAKNTDKLLKGSGNIFLNDTLGVDSAIRLEEKYFLIAEYGSVTSNMIADEYHYSGVNKTEATASTSTTSAIFISDTTLAQLKEPFPFYTNVYFDGYVKAVEELNKLLHKAYNQLLRKEDEKRMKKN